MGDDVTCSENYSSVFRDDALEGKVAFISGGGTGICFRITEALMRHGCHVAIGSRRIQVVERAAKLLNESALSRNSNAQCLALSLDVRSKASVESAMASTIQKFGKLDILVNGAAGNFLCEAEKLSENAWNTVVDIDLNGTFRCCQAAFRQAFQKNGGIIINITATLHWNGELLQAHAGSAKAGIEALSKHLANEWGVYGVRVNNIAPGPIADTTGFRKLGGELPEKYRNQWLQKLALKRFGSTHEVAQAAVFLASDASTYVTGSTVAVDGGSWFFGGGLVAEHMREHLRKSKL
uniref:2,4-dienoyl-CoA reductase [(3E)-enoyl-CoA-producing] n=1 Tax=Timspurckia oligopyrenoides TaxID=708627 RepID=A0A7S1ETL1_9RHOD|mmetsp:Transcript_7739/g.14052  ORF Transcript_7739/g.14052 Transcript_7739/m.14052 type:complete len:294 (+) Transcript_7739:49-930(+)